MSASDKRTERILAAALEVFARHGFRKTSMQDIADAAGISRAALYLRFRNKEDIFRSGSEAIHADVLQRTEAAFGAAEPFFDRLQHGLLAFALGFRAPLDSGGHAEELFDANMALAGDITERTQDELLRLIRKQLAQALTAGEIVSAQGHDADALADVVFTTVNGYKHAAGGAAALESRIALFVALLRGALSPPA